jgi:hypothetical protein
MFCKAYKDKVAQLEKTIEQQKTELINIVDAIGYLTFQNDSLTMNNVVETIPEKQENERLLSLLSAAINTSSGVATLYRTRVS